MGNKSSLCLYSEGPARRFSSRPVWASTRMHRKCDVIMVWSVLASAACQRKLIVALRGIRRHGVLQVWKLDHELGRGGQPSPSSWEGLSSSWEGLELNWTGCFAMPPTGAKSEAPYELHNQSDEGLLRVYVYKGTMGLRPRGAFTRTVCSRAKHACGVIVYTPCGGMHTKAANSMLAALMHAVAGRCWVAGRCGERPKFGVHEHVELGQSPVQSSWPCI